MLGHDILFALWLFWPAGIATLLPVLSAHTPLLRSWNSPMDSNRSWRGHRIFGDHKTWRGFLAGWIGGSLWAWMQTVWYHHSGFIQSVYPTSFSPGLFLAVGILVSLGSVVGDAAGSFFKRQFDIPSGQSWFPWDQLDFIIGGVVCSLPAVRLRWQEYLIILISWMLIHLLFGVLGYVTKLKPALI